MIFMIIIAALLLNGQLHLDYRQEVMPKGSAAWDHANAGLPRMHSQEGWIQGLSPRFGERACMVSSLKKGVVFKEDFHWQT